MTILLHIIRQVEYDLFLTTKSEHYKHKQEAIDWIVSGEFTEFLRMLQVLGLRKRERLLLRRRLGRALAVTIAEQEKQRQVQEQNIRNIKSQTQVISGES